MANELIQLSQNLYINEYSELPELYRYHKSLETVFPDMLKDYFVELRSKIIKEFCENIFEIIACLWFSLILFPIYAVILFVYLKYEPMMIKKTIAFFKEKQEASKAIRIFNLKIKIFQKIIEGEDAGYCSLSAEQKQVAFQSLVYLRQKIINAIESMRLLEQRVNADKQRANWLNEIDDMNRQQAGLSQGSLPIASAEIRAQQFEEAVRDSNFLSEAFQELDLLFVDYRSR